MNEQPKLPFFEDDSYEKFEDKFRIKKTTDDCFTPENIYNCVRDYFVEKFGLQGREIVRPFWPGGDYQRFEYPENCVVIDNPPFSIFSQICDWYWRRGIAFVLFGPGLVLMNPKTFGRVTYYPVGVSIAYANGAQINTSFVSNLGDCIAESLPDLREILEDENKRNIADRKKKVRNVILPDEVLTTARMNWFSVHGEHFRVERDEAKLVGTLDCGYNVFGRGLLLSENAAARRVEAERETEKRIEEERATAERVDVLKIELSEKEKEICRSMEQSGNTGSC